MSIEELEKSCGDAIVARRNLMLGVWAGLRIGYRGEALASYAEDVMRSDLIVPGPDDVIAKVSADFAEAGVDLGAASVLAELKSIERRVRHELQATD
jgi:hypothetical protein